MPGALTQALAGALGSRPPPRPVVEERKTLFTVHSMGVMLAVTHQLVELVLHTLACVSIAFTPGKRRDAGKHGTATKARQWVQTHDVQGELKPPQSVPEFTSQICKPRNRARLSNGCLSVWYEEKINNEKKKNPLFKRGWGINQTREDSF